MTFRMHDDSSLFVRPFAIEGNSPITNAQKIDIVITA